MDNPDTQVAPPDTEEVSTEMPPPGIILAAHYWRCSKPACRKVNLTICDIRGKSVVTSDGYSERIPAWVDELCGACSTPAVKGSLLLYIAPAVKFEPTQE